MNRREMLAATLALGGCATAPGAPDVFRLYDAARMLPPAERRPIVTLPGMLGSRLRQGTDGPYLWGGPDRLSLDPAAPDEARLLALPIGAGTEPLAALRDGVVVDGVLRRARARLLGATVEEEVYDGLAAALNAGGYDFSRSLAEERARRGENPGSLEFPYDWRRDLVEAARDLDAFVERKADQVARVRRTRWGARLAPEDVRFDFVAHSMGALVLRWWLMYGARDLPETGPMPPPDWAGARRAACVIFVAPPFLGSILAVRSLIEGRRFGPLQPEHPPGLLGTFPALYQLAPRDRHRRLRLGAADGPSPGPLHDAGIWIENRWGLADPAQADLVAHLTPGLDDRARRCRVEAYLARVLDRAARVQEALDRPGGPPGADLFLVVGTGLDTPAGLVIDELTRRPVRTLSEEGDGVVLRASALSDESQGGHRAAGPRRSTRYRTVLLLPGEHVAITRDPVFADNLIYWLLDAPRA